MQCLQYRMAEREMQGRGGKGNAQLTYIRSKVMLQVVLETIAIALAVLSLTLHVMFNCSLFKMMPVAVEVVKRQMNALSNNNWEINGSLSKDC